MSKTNAAQLALLDLPATEPQRARPRADRRRRPLSASQTARHCNALLAELERVSLREQSSAARLAELYSAAERFHGQS
jgi:hypothetical protein